jgi:hypothetical protein
MVVVKTIIHECIHAYLNVKLASPAVGMSIPNLNNLEVAETINNYCNFTGEQDQHDFIYYYMLPTLQTILPQVKDLLVDSASNSEVMNNVFVQQSPGQPSGPWNWNQYYKYLSLKGLESCDFFRAEIAILNNNPTTIINPTEFLMYNQYNTNGANDITRTCTN